MHRFHCLSITYFNLIRYNICTLWSHVLLFHWWSDNRIGCSLFHCRIYLLLSAIKRETDVYLGSESAWTMNRQQLIAQYSVKVCFNCRLIRKQFPRALICPAESTVIIASLAMEVRGIEKMKNAKVQEIPTTRLSRMNDFYTFVFVNYCYSLWQLYTFYCHRRTIISQQ